MMTFMVLSGMTFWPNTFLSRAERFGRFRLADFFCGHGISLARRQKGLSEEFRA